MTHLSGYAEAPTSSVLFVNGRFWPVSPGGAWARTLLVRDGRIIARDQAPSEMRLGGVPVVDLEGRTAIPGPVDAHCHLVSYGMQRLREADLRGCRSLDDLLARLKAHLQTLQAGSWLLGRGFEQDLLGETGWPTRADLDGVSGDVPVRITRVCGHALVANTAALHAAGLDPRARTTGLPEGVLTEEAMNPIFRATPAPTAAEWLQAARWACQAAANAGFVGVHSLMANAEEIRALLDLRAAGPLPIRVRMQLPFGLLEHAARLGLRTGFGDEMLRFGAVKLFSDGSLGARTAALAEGYSDAPDCTGELIHAPAELTARVRRIREAGFQVCIHAIGDRALAVTLDSIRAAGDPAAGLTRGWRLPPRIEHASLVSASLIRSMLKLGVGAAVQPQFAHSDYWVPERLGEARSRGCYAFRTLYEAGVPLAGSTDCPVEPLHALAAIGQLVYRPSWSPDEGVALDTALRIFSEGSYRIDGAGVGPGRLAEGEWADFTVLGADPGQVRPGEIERIPVEMTVVGGRITFVEKAGCA